MFDALVETCNTVHLGWFPFALVGAGMTDCACYSKRRLALGLLAVCVLEGTFTGASSVVILPFFIALIFSAGSCSSIELVVKLQVELEGVTALCIRALAAFLALAAIECLSSSNSFSTDFFNASKSYPLEIAGEGALDRHDTLPLFD